MIQIDMEMPQNCKFCPLHDVNPDQCPIRTIYKDDYATSRFTDCPLYKIAEDTDTISRQAVIDALQDRYKLYSWDDGGAQKAEIGAIIREIYDMPSAQPEPLSDAYTKAVWTWLLDYQIKAAELKGRYTPYEVLSWVANDWRKEHERSD